MPITRGNLDTRFIVVSGDQPAGVALSELLHTTWLIVKTIDPQTGQVVDEQVLLASALTHVIEGTPVDKIPVGYVPTQTLPQSMDQYDAQAKVNNNKDICFVVKDDDGKPLGALPPEVDLLWRPHSLGGMIEVRCPHCQKWVFVSAQGPHTCPLCGQTF
jgi:hypothetical protein